MRAHMAAHFGGFDGLGGSIPAGFFRYMYGDDFFDDDDDEYDDDDDEEYYDDDEEEEDYYEYHSRRDTSERQREAMERKRKDQEAADTLEIDVNSSLLEIKTAYRSLARRYHPDKWTNQLGLSQEQGQEKFKMIVNAYEHLMGN